MASLWVKRKFLGNGSYGKVFLAQSTALLAYYKSPALVPFVALKSCLASRSSSLRLERDVFRELGGCDRIVKCFGSGVSVENGVEYFDLVLEYAPGGSLEQLVRFRGGRVPEMEASCYTRMLLKGLSHVHGKGWVYCDLKPANILVFPSKHGGGVFKCSLKLADFGSAKRGGEISCGFVDPCSGRKNRGTLLYSSPESVEFGEHEAPMDVWALGCIVFEMLIGDNMWSNYRSFNARVLGDLIAGYQDSGLIFCDDLSANAEDFLRKCLTRDVEDRWTADQLLEHPFITESCKMLPLSESGQTPKIMGYQRIPFSSPFVVNNPSVFVN
ncbi:hypothetical protein DCAR_0623859 [Daucus carota subsp. sativus]|uniref:Protein kinase domain-containing protein n=1 Tax=Daucus carota subsp. sativus TaxID=79200 RepID=A0A161ZU93_DAUCS|nr:PREDICTED: mitogen-activated protein kinase kinase kinase 3-like [Daucus carota subsp. sativus]WOH04450.1 hypothetical protein DCAR_0623859 [Daucus carota subsp. sativus]